MKINELQQNLLVQTPANEVLQVSNIYETRVTAQVVYPLPPRTTVREYTVDQVARWKVASDHMVKKYEEVWGFTK
jgi:hypothetical protein